MIAFDWVSISRVGGLVGIVAGSLTVLNWVGFSNPVGSFITANILIPVGSILI